VGETRLITGTIFTNKLFAGQREMAGVAMAEVLLVHNKEFIRHRVPAGMIIVLRM
jgi:hypothetical protein